MPSALSTIGYLLAAPFMTMFLSVLGGLAVITSLLTSSFIFVKLVLLAIEFSLGIALCSIRQLLSWLLFEPKSQTLYKQQRQQPNNYPTSSVRLKRQRSPPSDMHISFKAPIKNKYSLSVPSTPDLTPHHHELNI